LLVNFRSAPTPNDFHRQDIERILVAIMAEFQRLLEAMGAKLAPLVAVQSDEREVRAIVDAEIRRIRRALEDAEAAMIQQIASTQH
jgi:hypothetical protein